jgi:hypothetical protein
VALPSPPSYITQFYNRAYFVCLPNQVWFSDSLFPLHITNSTQFLVLGDSTPITSVSQQSFDASTGGQIQALLVLKSNFPFQITGDSALNTLTLTPLQGLVGTQGGRTVAYAPVGTIFLGNESIQYITSDGGIQELDTSVKVPFQNVAIVSRASASYNNNIYRISLQNTAATGSPLQEYWYHFDLEQWSGPHTFASSVSVAYGGTTIAAVDGLVGLWQSDVLVSSSSTFTENGTQLQWMMQSATVPDTDMCVRSVSEITTDFIFSSGSGSVTVNILDGNGIAINTSVISVSSSSAIWGVAVWGAFTWNASMQGFKSYSISYNAPVVTKKFAMQWSGFSLAGFRIGNTWMRVEDLGYTNV